MTSTTHFIFPSCAIPYVPIMKDNPILDFFSGERGTSPVSRSLSRLRFGYSFLSEAIPSPLIGIEQERHFATPSAGGAHNEHHHGKT